MTSRRLSNDDDRARVRAFFDANLADGTAWPVLSRAEDIRLGLPAILRVVEDEEEILGAVYASHNPEDVIRWRQRGSSETAEVIAEQMLMIHDLAVAPAGRRSGIGRQLVEAVLDDGRANGSSIVTLAFDGTQPGLSSFYGSLGFAMLGNGEDLDVQFSALPMLLRFPQDDRRYRWAFRVLNRTRASAGRRTD